MWRITDDFWDNWDLLYAMFERAEKWCVHSGAGHWADADMLPVGHILQDYSPENKTKFTSDEEKTMLTLWCFLRSPLMIGCELTKLDEETLKRLTNEKLLDMLANSWGARQLYKRGNEIVWFSRGEKDGYYAALFNTDAEKREISFSLSEAELFGEYEVWDMWEETEVTVKDGVIKTEVNGHGVYCFKLK